MAKYLILIYDDEKAWADADEKTFNEIMEGHNAFGRSAGDALISGNALRETTTATSIRPDADVEGGFAITDGPFAETKEQLGGYYLIEAADLDAAIAIAKRVPVLSGGLEVRPIMVFDHG
jgi:hypothetical protein